MAANDLIIRISAVDKATAVVRKVNDSISKALRPVTNVQRSLKALGREAGIERMGKSLVGVSRAAADVATKIGSILAPLTAVVGIGSIAGIGMLAKKWGDFGSEILRSAQNIGMSASSLQAYRGAAEMAGVSSQAFTGNMKALGETLQDSLHGRNNDALMLLNRLGISIKTNADGAVNAEAAFGDLADRIASIKSPQVQALIARTLGVEDSLPLLRKGRAGIEELTAAQYRYNLIMDGPALQAAKQFRESMTMMDLTLEKVRNTIGNALVPILQPMIDRVAKWAAANQDLIATRVAEFVDGLAKAIQSIDWSAVVAGIKSFVDGIKDAVEWVGGWKNAMLIVAGVMAAPLLLAIGNLAAALVSLSGLAIRGVIGSVGLLSAGFTGLMLKMALLTEKSLPGLSKGFLAAGSSMETGLLGKFTQFAVFAPLAYEGGKLLGTALWKGFLEDTNIGDKIGRLVTIVRAQFGDEDAKAALEAELNAKAGLPPTGTPIPGGRRPASRAPVPTAVAKVQAEADIQKLMGMGWSRAQAAGIAANIQRESQGNEKAVGDKGQAYGLAQWHPDRQAAFAKWAGKDIRASSRDEQLAFINYELRQGGEQGAGGALAKARNAAEAAAIVSRQYERPADVVGEAAKRAGMAVALAVPQTGPAVPTPYTPPAQAAAMQGGAPPAVPGQQVASAAQAGVVTVQIDFVNAPPGMKSRVQTSGPVVANTKIAFAMPEYGV
jgi:hypothetical protein